MGCNKSKPEPPKEQHHAEAKEKSATPPGEDFPANENAAPKAQKSDAAAKQDPAADANAVSSQILYSKTMRIRNVEAAGKCAASGASAFASKM